MLVKLATSRSDTVNESMLLYRFNKLIDFHILFVCLILKNKIRIQFYPIISNN